MAFMSVAIPAAMSIGKALLQRGKKAESVQIPQLNIPEYGAYKSKYDDPSSEQIYDFYSRRSKGTDVGLGADDLTMLNAAAIDQSTQEGNELTRRAVAGHKTRTGGMETGGTGRIERAGVGKMLQSRSKAMRDIAIQNAVLKHNDIWAGTEGLSGFLGDERSQQNRQWTAARAKALDEYGPRAAQAEEDAKTTELNRQRKAKFADDLWSVGDSLSSRLTDLFKPKG
ncbi:MAG: hypothetical protein MOGMAGMI_02340 [Candidatus Omnitrophica bacterium]|nr:hypothetical protein [Candidatus Omnitrophota bacterium]